MTKEQLSALRRALESLTEIERQADCSDRFFRQVYAARIRALCASGLIEALAAETGKERDDEQNGRLPL